MLKLCIRGQIPSDVKPILMPSQCKAADENILEQDNLSA